MLNVEDVVCSRIIVPIIQRVFEGYIERLGIGCDNSGFVAGVGFNHPDVLGAFPMTPKAYVGVNFACT